MSIDSHVIRLRGPWNYEISQQDATPSRGIFDFGGDWREISEHSPGGAILLRRRFGRPGHLDADERVMLVVEGPELSPAQILVNDQNLTSLNGDGPLFRADITALLQGRNELTIRFDRSASAGSSARLLNDVRLEIEFV